jgi:NAD(P)-dependent dehydrogenase (short-subunit alcohol dehydrogenase family)
MKRIAIITGASGGIGLATAEALAKKGYSLRVVGRTPAKLDAAVEGLRSITTDVKGFQADFSSLEQVRELAGTLLERDEPIHVLVNNAGVWHSEFRRSKDGYEDTFAVNHLAPFLLTTQLLPRMRESDGDRRIVHVSSRLHRQAGTAKTVFGRLFNVLNLSVLLPNGGPEAQFEFDALDREEDFRGLEAYARSKLAQVIISAELARREPEVTSNVVHPGSVQTDVTRGTKWLYILKPISGPFLRSPAQGAATSVHVATAPELQTVTGKYFASCKPARAAAIASDAGVGKRLWELSLEWTNASN